MQSPASPVECCVGKEWGSLRTTMDGMERVITVRALVTPTAGSSAPGKFLPINAADTGTPKISVCWCPKEQKTR